MRLRFIIFPLLLLIGCSSVHHPSDQTLADRLRLKEADFNKLIDMLNEDSDVIRISNDSAFLSSGADPHLSEERFDEYRRLFKTLNLDGGVYRQHGSIRLIASTKGSFFSGVSEKSYVYSSLGPTPLVESLDSVIKTNAGEQPPVYKRLYGNWYLYYESW